MALHTLVAPQHGPPAAMQQMAAELRSMYVALVPERLTPVEAVTPIGCVRGGKTGAGSTWRPPECKRTAVTQPVSIVV
jgi:hypothetical protein